MNNQLININNLFNFADKSLTCYNCIIHILDFSFFISIMSINCNDNKYSFYSDEFLYIINYSYPNNHYYNFFINHYYRTINQLNINVIDYNNNVISFINTFSKGSVHGYSGFWYTLITYLNNTEIYKDLDIIIYKETDNGMLTIINQLCSIGIIKNKILFLEKDVKYKFSSVTYIENQYHVFNGKLENMVTEFIDKYNIINNKLYQNEIYQNENYCILKSR